MPGSIPYEATILHKESIMKTKLKKLALALLPLALLAAGCCSGTGASCVADFLR
jgi:hypothetical protein